MKRLALTGVVLLATVFGANAQQIGGMYDVLGTNLDGSQYKGTAEIRVITDTTCEIYWTTGGTTSQGICMRNGPALAAGYVLGDKVGLVIYEIKANSVLEGLWTIAGTPGNGAEVLTPQ